MPSGLMEETFEELSKKKCFQLRKTTFDLHEDALIDSRRIHLDTSSIERSESISSTCPKFQKQSFCFSCLS